MIDEKKFMEFMTALEDAGADHVSFDDLRKFVDEFTKIGDWISCSERLPEENDSMFAKFKGTKMNKNELRPCIVKMLKYPKRKRNQCSKIDPEEEIHKGYFHIWGSESYVVNAYLIGETSGQISTLYGVVEYEDGTVHRVPPECITFTE